MLNLSFRICKFCICFALCFSSGTNAEPSTAINYLMDEPHSLFDMGIYRLDTKLNNSWLANGTDIGKSWLGGGVSYDWSSNKIKIFGGMYIVEKPSFDSCKEILAKFHEVVADSRAFKDSDFANGNVAVWMVHPVAQVMGHEGWQRNNEPKPEDLAKDLINNTLVSVGIVSTEFNDNSLCEAPLANRTKVTFQKL